MPHAHRQKGSKGHRPSQDKVMAFIQSCGSMPTREEIRAHMGWKNVGSVKECLLSLAARGLIGRDRDGWRWVFTYPAETNKE